MSNDFPDTRFKCEITTSPERTARLENQYIEFDADDIIGHTSLAGCNGAHVFAYMYRRFGPPPLSGDEVNDMCGGWLLTTPSDRLLLKVRPYFHPYASMNFDPYLIVGEDWFRQEGRDAPDDLKEAYRTAALDLLRPVWIRDQAINVLGEVDYNDDLIDYHDELCLNPVYEVPYAQSSVAGIPADLVGNDDYSRFVRLLEMVNGRGENGLEVATNALRCNLLARLKDENPHVQELVALAAIDRHDNEILAHVDHDSWAVACTVLDILKRGDLNEIKDIPAYNAHVVSEAKQIVGILTDDTRPLQVFLYQMQEARRASDRTLKP